MPPFVITLLSQGLGLLGNAALAKGKEWVEEKTGVQLQPDMPPEDLAKLRQFELEHEEELQRLKLEDNKLDLETFKAEVADRGSARDANTKIATSSDAPWYQKALLPAIAAFVTIGFFGCMFGLFYVSYANVQIDTNAKDVLVYAFGAMTAGWMAVMNYLFGSSHGSRDNQVALASIAKGGRS